MQLLVDLFGYLGILLHGLVISAQSIALGSTAFLILLLRPQTADLGGEAAAKVKRLAIIAALSLALAEFVSVALQTAVLTATLDVPVSSILGANFAVSGMIKFFASLALAAALALEAPGAPLLALGTAILGAAVMTTHAAARLDHSNVLLAVSCLHQLGAAIWIGAIPAFILVLPRLPPGPALAAVGSGFSRISMAGVSAILISGVIMSLFYIGSIEAAYGTAYGVMVGAKITMFGMLLLLGLGNFLITEKLRHHPGTDILRLRRFAEVEIGIGLTIFFCAASLTSVPPGVDLPNDRATIQEIVARDFTPVLPRLISPDHDQLAIAALQQKLNEEAAARKAAPDPAFIEGSGDLPPRNPADIAWSEYNHHWAGIFVTIIGLLGLLHRAGNAWARHWPLVFYGLAAFLFIRSDPEIWPLGQIGLLESLRDVEVLQHRAFLLLVIAFATVEWGVRAGWLKSRAASHVFPLICAGGGALLLTHSHAIANIKDQLLIELTHTPLALAAIVAGWARWLELRLPGQIARRAGWVWPLCFIFIGTLLLLYREA
jgi:putative copper resistance protein D